MKLEKNFIHLCLRPGGGAGAGERTGAPRSSRRHRAGPGGGEQPVPARPAPRVFSRHLRAWPVRAAARFAVISHRIEILSKRLRVNSIFCFLNADRKYALNFLCSSRSKQSTVCQNHPKPFICEVRASLSSVNNTLDYYKVPSSNSLQ